MMLFTRHVFCAKMKHFAAIIFAPQLLARRASRDLVYEFTKHNVTLSYRS
jgi:hypothetical protein